ncbi:MAG: hypothetical protein N3F09_02000 [Bacteroidia bacterium]|nr:hypothetical protein [Bacteroidia bacterium]
MKSPETLFWLAILFKYKEKRNTTYYKIRYEEVLKKVKLMPDIIELESFSKIGSTVSVILKCEPEAKLITESKYYSGDNRISLLFTNAEIQNIIDILNCKYKNNPLFNSLFNFFLDYYTFGDEIRDIENEEFLKILDEIDNDYMQINSVCVLTGITEFARICLENDLDVEVDDPNVIRSYRQYKIKKVFQNLFQICK